MKLIQKLSDEIEDELKGAKCYAKMALEYKSEYQDVAKALYNISLQEMEHMKMLHDCVVDIIKEYREENGEPPADMLAVYEYLHKQQIDKAAYVRTLQSMYKEG